MADKLIKAFIIIAMFVFNYLLCIVLHEAGHLCMGKATGYKMVSFRIGPAKLYKKNGRWTLMRETVPGTLGQCVMLPPESDTPEKAPSMLYHFGGGLFNIITALTALVCGFFVSGEYGKDFFIILFIISFALSLLNLYPAKILMPNDGYNMLLARKSPSDRKAMYHMLQIAGSTELSPGEMSSSYFEYDDEGEYVNVMKLMNGYRYLDRGQFEEAEKLFAEVYNTEDKGMTYYRMEAGKELTFCMILRGAEPGEISEVFNDELRKYVTDKKSLSPSSLRVLYAYDHLIIRDEEKAETEYWAALERLKKAPVGDVKMETKLLEAARR